ncbi:MAG: AI-2E family transporter, partial [Tenericutes bacterium]|nr:AI-2E family transporter [Mycoplasmatota bacterium]
CINMTKKLKKQITELIIFSGITLWIVFNYKLFFDFVNFVLKLAMPIVVGIAIAFIINVPMRQIENKIFKIEKRKHKKLIRLISLLLSIVIIFGILALILFLIIPEFIEAIGTLGKNLPKSLDWINSVIDKVSNISPVVDDYVKNINVGHLVSSVGINANNVINIMISFLSSTISKVVMFFFGFIIAIYILADKENLGRQAKKIIYAFFNTKVSDEIIRIYRLTNTTFTNFITGQCLDACLTGFEFFIILSIIKIPYALILGVLFAVTALIPYIGAFITLVVGAILVAVSNPINAVWYIIVFFVLQQFDDNFTYPKIVGKSVGLPALWALIAVLIGGSIFGFIGMIISIPISSVLYTLLKEFVNYRLAKKSENKLDKK